MELGIMQPYFFPYIGYFQLINSVDKFIVYDLLQFTSKSWMSRNRYMVKNGEPAFFNLSMQKKSMSMEIADIELNHSLIWRKKLLKEFSHNYKNAPFFDEVFPIIESVLFADVKMLTDINILSILGICKYLEISTEIVKSGDVHRQLENSMKENKGNLARVFQHINLTEHIEKLIRIIEICKIENAETYINPIGGLLLYDKSEFKQNNIDLKFIQTRNISYQQFSNDFFPHLSIIDVLMHCGKEGTQKLIQEYDFV